MKSNTAPFFSIIIPTYNRESLIGKTINSVLAQQESFEIIVVDDGSTDQTKEVVLAIIDDRVNYYYQENGERGAARNFGVQKAKGTYVTFLDSDDLYYENHLAVAKEFIAKVNPKIFFQQYEITTPSGQKKATYKPQGEIINKQLIEKGNFMACMGVFIEKEVFLLNPFNTDRRLAGSEDYELWLRYAAHYPIHYSKEITSTLIWHDERSVLNIDKDQLIERKELMLKYLFEDKGFEQKYGKYKSHLQAEAFSYVSLHLILANDYNAGLKYFLKSLRVKPAYLFKPRSLAIIKKLLFRSLLKQ